MSGSDFFVEFRSVIRVRCIYCRFHFTLNGREIVRESVERTGRCERHAKARKSNLQS